MVKTDGMLKKIRIGVSVAIFSLVTLYFLDFASLLPNRLHVLTQLQLVPALIALNVVTLVVILALTLLFGRVYCSSLCPMGVFQDIMDWVAKKGQRKKKYPVLKERKFLRWTIVAVTVVAFFAGANIVVSLLDPYSAYGRMASMLFKPLYLLGNNLAAWIDNYFKDYRFYKLDVFIAGTAAFATAAITMLVIGYLSYKYGRLYCNTICPVGTVLGFVSRAAIFKIRINHEKCNSCSLCAMKCKASCIDSATKTIDYSRCVVCFNCLETCNRNAMAHKVAPVRKRVTVAVPEQSEQKVSKRQFLYSLVLLGMTGVQKLFGKEPDSTKKVKEIFTSHNVSYKRAHPITPPGSGNVNHFNDHCTACHLCVSKCPSNVLKPTLLEYGLAGMLQPMMDFQHGYCNYHCTLCADICPTNALEKITQKEKKTIQVGHVEYVKENCVVVTDGTDCGACSEHCPTQAVSMQPYKNGLKIPTIDQNLCVGCGGCEYICPTRPYRAIYVVGNPVHKQAAIPEEKEQKKIQVEDFGF